MRKELFWFLMVVLFTSFKVGVSSIENGQSPICILCTCQPTNPKVDDSDYEVTCLSKLTFDILNISFWKNETSNKLYQISSLTIHNNVYKNLSEEFPSSALVYLNLAKNAISSVHVGVFKNLSVLEVLILSNNEIDVFKTETSEERAVSLPLPYLTELRLDNNKLRSLNSTLFKNFISLRILDLSSNPIENIDDETFKAITSLGKLKELYLQNTGIKVLPNHMLHTLNSLQTLDLSGNPYDSIPRTLAEVKSLTNLYMNNTSIKRLSHQNAFPKIPSLKTLHMCHNEELSYIGRFSFEGLENIEDIRLSNNFDLTMIEPLAFAKTTNDQKGYDWLKIEKLHLQYNNISHLKPNVFGNYDNLEELDIGGNEWICDCGIQWLLDYLYPRYLNISEVQAKSTKCSGPTAMMDITFQSLYENKTRLKCPDDPQISPSTILYTAIGFFSGFVITIPLVIIVMLGYQRRWCNAIKDCRYSKFQNDSPDMEFSTV